MANNTDRKVSATESELVLYRPAKKVTLNYKKKINLCVCENKTNIERVSKSFFLLVVVFFEIECVSVYFLLYKYIV